MKGTAQTGSSEPREVLTIAEVVTSPLAGQPLTSEGQ